MILKANEFDDKSTADNINDQNTLKVPSRTKTRSASRRRVTRRKARPSHTRLRDENARTILAFGTLAIGAFGLIHALLTNNTILSSISSPLVTQTMLMVYRYYFTRK